MSRSVEQIKQSMVGKVHPGFALGKRNGNFDAKLEAAAQLIADVEKSAEELMNEIDPRNAVRLLPDFERVLGPDKCGRDVAGLSIKQRQQLAHQRWTAVGGQSIPYLMQVARNLGFEIEIEEFWPSKAGGLRAGQKLIPEGEQFLWRVKLNLGVHENFVAGGSQAGDRLGEFILSGIECELQRIAHSHTTPVFSYILNEEAA